MFQDSLSKVFTKNNRTNILYPFYIYINDQWEFQHISIIAMY